MIAQKKLTFLKTSASGTSDYNYWKFIKILHTEPEANKHLHVGTRAVCGVQLPDTWWLCSQWSADFPTSLHKQRWKRFLFSSDYDNSCFTRRCLCLKLTAILRYHKEENGRGVSWKSRITAHVIWSALIMVIKSSCVPVSFPANTWEQEKQHTPGSVDKTPCQTIIHHTVLIFFSFFLLVIGFDFTSCSAAVLAWCTFLGACVEWHWQMQWKKCLSLQTVSVGKKSSVTGSLLLFD